MSRINWAVITVSLLLLFVVASFGQLTFPKSFGDTYSTFIAYSNYENGYTISHKEYSNGKLKLARFEAGNITIFDIAKNTLYMYDTRNQSNCNAYTDVTHQLFLPSFMMIPSLIGDATFNFINFTTIDRGINCSLFQNQTISSSVTNATTKVTVDNNVNVTNVQSVSNGVCLKGVNVTTLNISTVCTADPYNLTVSCSFTNVTDSTATIPSCTFQVRDTTQLQSFVGDANTSKITIETKSITTVVNQTKTFYLDTSARYPVRLTMSSSFVRDNSTVSSGNSEIDWIDWIESKDQQVSIYTIPANCPVVASGGFNPFAMSPNKTLGPSPTNITGLPFGFSLVLEEEMQGLEVNSIVWNADFKQNYESIEQDHSSGGDVITLLTSTKATFSFNTFTLDCSTSDVPNPFTSDIRRNIVYRVLHELVKFNWTFVSRSVYRSIDADVYTATVAEPNYPYTYNLTMYMVAPGWSFLGRYGVGPDTSIPLAIESAYSSGDIKGKDKWDIYIFTPQAMPNNYLNISQSNCYPTIPSQYNSTVYVNFGDVGATYYYNETFISNSSYYAAVGKFGGPYDVAIITNSTNSTTGTFTYKSGAACTSYNLSSVVMNDKYTESIRYLVRGPKFGATSFVNFTRIDGYNIGIWKSAISSGDYFDVIDNKTYAQNTDFYYYWRVLSPGQYIPYRMSADYKLVDPNTSTSIRNFSVYIEWMTFNTGIQNASIYQPATNCVKSNTTANLSQIMTLPTRNFMAKPIDTIQPTLPPAFNANIEIERDLSNSTGVTFSQKVYVQWKYDSVNKAESFQIIYPDGNYSNNIMICYTDTMGQGYSVFSNNGSPFSWFGQPLYVNPFVYGLGSLNFDGKIGTDIIYNFTNFVKQSKFSNPRPTFSGVPVDQWTANNGTLVFSWYPSGWQYPNNPATQRVPTGAQRVNPSNNMVATETWKFLQFSVSDPKSGWAEVCKNATRLKPSTFSLGLSNAAIAVIISVSSLATVGIGLLVYCVIKRRSIQGKQQPGHILLEERNEAHHRLHEDHEDDMQREDY
ncbi:hypothetical protein PPL_07695 [Heterostelium album PN500]|uniref:Uncharacterized protein n=1 Tax=Heterostelium pallidum (strain ATCC 26659 / Pp 5 / PN500) TaxID=670386 RepID=D3BGP3_HETP5|nr:hypothetical protein PPL_07695 [Heterostelium album PN500]EFA79277.1 hypothetical protein PPL_07695 [Heterostelium album PN500]|eukprot:XP_020431398.1 hypothetical protein PPL_07695 [Heterostelium album PN500]